MALPIRMLRAAPAVDTEGVEPVAPTAPRNSCAVVAVAQRMVIGRERPLLFRKVSGYLVRGGRPSRDRREYVARVRRASAASVGAALGEGVA